MKLLLKIADLVFSITSERELFLEDKLKLFTIEEGTCQADITIHFSWNPELFQVPSGVCIGEDLLHTYYETSDNLLICMTKGGYKGAIGRAVYDRRNRSILCAINEKPFFCTPGDLGALLRYLPLLSVYRDNEILFFHASQVSYGHTGILFTAPSGGGKTTQSRLWESTEQTSIVCNDRTYLRYRQKWYTYGCPVDGSAPVCSTQINSLGCIVVLKKAYSNQIRRLVGRESLAALLSQLIFDSWQQNAVLSAVDLLTQLIADIPIYELQCTPDESAVTCLKEQLQKDGVLTDEKNQ